MFVFLWGKKFSVLLSVICVVLSVIFLCNSFVIFVEVDVENLVDRLLWLKKFKLSSKVFWLKLKEFVSRLVSKECFLFCFVEEIVRICCGWLFNKICVWMLWIMLVFKGFCVIKLWICVWFLVFVMWWILFSEMMFSCFVICLSVLMELFIVVFIMMYIKKKVMVSVIIIINSNVLFGLDGFIVGIVGLYSIVFVLMLDRDSFWVCWYRVL